MSNESIGLQALFNQTRQNISWIDYTDLLLLYEKKGEIKNTNNNKKENDYFVKDDTIRFNTKKVFQKYTEQKIHTFAQNMYYFYNNKNKFTNITNTKYLTVENIQKILTSILKNKKDPQFEKFYKWNSNSPLLPEGDRYKFLAYDIQDFSVFEKEYTDIINQIEKKFNNNELYNYNKNNSQIQNQKYINKLKEYNEYLKENHFITYVLNNIQKAQNSAWYKGKPYNEVINRNIKQSFKDFEPASNLKFKKLNQQLMKSRKIYISMIKEQFKKNENNTRITDKQLDLFSFFNLTPDKLPSQEDKFPLNLVNRDLQDNTNRGPYIYMGRLLDDKSYFGLSWTNERTQKNVYLNGYGVFVINVTWNMDFYKATPLIKKNINGKEQFEKYPTFKENGFKFDTATTSFDYKWTGGKPTKPKVVKKKPVKVINKKRQIKTKYSKK